MDLAERRLSVRKKIAVPGGLYWKSAVAVTLSVLLLLVVAKLVWGIPKPLLMTASVSFLGWSVVFWSLYRSAKGTIYSRIAILLLAWLSSTALALGVVHRIDRAGWVWFQLTGYDLAVAEDLRDRVNLPTMAFLSQNPFFFLDPQGANKLVLKRGDYHIDETIIIPAGLSLTIEPGTVLRFGAGRSLVSYSPVIARGTEQQPIIFTAKNKWLKWGVVAVVNAGKSVFHHVSFDYGRWAIVNGIRLPGNLSLIEADVEIVHSRFVNLFGKDGVYIQQAQALVQNNIFRNTYKDGLDFDGGSGRISRNQFINCEDEAIDLSGDYDLEVFDNTILDSGGGRIAADKNLEIIKSLNSLGYADGGQRR